jgi:hypothetical protein
LYFIQMNMDRGMRSSIFAPQGVVKENEQHRGHLDVTRNVSIVFITRFHPIDGIKYRRPQRRGAEKAYDSEVESRVEEKTR